MGVPKFFRYISERYPCLSEQLKEYQIPEFDNLYLDMNGIIHTCSHPNDADVLFRIEEQVIFRNIFHYVEILFSIIQPKKLFFMAVDGVAPRAKINQQRGRRFRSAKEAEVLEAKAKAKGVEIPQEARFDSNCITPGTLFMSELNKQLKYFISYKISTDKLWQKCTVIFSGSEVPGEGEHKIMDYIRYMKSQPNYDPNTRHCLYGLDADLIMLGLCTHEPHFSLLREEVVFGKKQKRIATPEETNFCLLHLSLMRQYLEHEFSPVKGKLSFPFDIEKIIDDWVLIGFLVGNDFIPHLPNLHIAQGILPILYNVYMDVLPTLDGYINEAGTLNLGRFEKFLEELSHIDMKQFEEVCADLKYFEAKTGRRPNENERYSYKQTNESPENEVPLKSINKALEALIKSTDEMALDLSDDEEDTDSDTYNEEFIQHKRDYYMNKLEYKNVDEDVLRSQAEGYIRAIQWNLNYYYNGCCSWSWFYPHHYAPYVSDIKNFKDLKLKFELGEPFLPFQQLLAVLPAASKNLLPEAYQDLLTEKESPIINYYPVEFKTDLNGKKQEWEAVVLIPFINENHLLEAMKPFNDKLTDNEKERNTYGPMCVFTYTEKSMGIEKAPKYFPSFPNHASVTLLNREDILVPREKLIKGLCPGVNLDVYFPGFPTLQHIEHTAKLEKAKVRVFQQPSREDSIILYITPKPKVDLHTIAHRLLGKNIFVQWPHLQEAQVVAVSNSFLKLNVSTVNESNSKNFTEYKIKGNATQQWASQKKIIFDNYRTRMGIDLDEIEFLVHARPIVGRRYKFGPKNKITLKKQWSENAVAYAYQAVVEDIKFHESDLPQYTSVTEIFVKGSTCFMLGHPYYGAMGEVLEHGIDSKTGRVKVVMLMYLEPSFENIRKKESETRSRYMQGSVAAQHLGISSHLLSRVTGSILVIDLDDENGGPTINLNIGLNLKFNKKNEEIPGYTKKENGQWLYSHKAIDLIRSYMQKFPELFEKLDRIVSTVDILRSSDLFPNGTNQLEEIRAWLKEQQKSHCLESHACGTEVLEPELIKDIEKEMDAFLQTKNSPKAVSIQVKPQLLYKPGLNDKTLQPDPGAVHKILDRIIVVKESFTVPLGYKGIIVGIQKAEHVLDCRYEVLFYKSFVGGLTLYGCSPDRLYRLSATDFINISHGVRVEYEKCGKIEVPMKQYWRWQSQTSPQKQSVNQPHANNSAFASLGPSNAPMPIMVQQKQRMPYTGKVVNEQPKHFNYIQSSNFEVQKPNTVCILSKQAATRQQVVKQGQSTEFQALWNELHMYEMNKAHALTELRPPAVEQKNVKTSANSVPQAPQDPSEFLKAMLKISDDNSQKSVPQTSNSSEAPPLVQQMFDHARQVEKRKENIKHCIQLLTYYQLNGNGFPRYYYYPNEAKSLVRAQIVLPDSRVFDGDYCASSPEAAENVAKKVCQTLKLNQMPVSNMTAGQPQRWFKNQQNPNPNQMMPQVIMPPMPVNLMRRKASDTAVNMLRPEWSTMPQPPQPPRPSFPAKKPLEISNWREHPSQNNGEKKAETTTSKMKKTTPFVPLQAEKKNRNSASKITQSTVKSTKDQVKKETVNQNTTTPQTSIDITQKETKKEEQPHIKKQEINTNASQKSQKTVRRKKPRIAANFASASVLNSGNGTQQ